MNTEQNNLGYVRLYFVTANGLLLTQIITLFMLTKPDRWTVASLLNTILAVNLLFLFPVLKER